MIIQIPLPDLGRGRGTGISDKRYLDIYKVRGRGKCSVY
jgi:hypothetical protein